MKRKDKWIKRRHKVVTALLRPIFTLLTPLIYHIKIDRFRDQGDRNWLILSNHQTDFDQFFVGLAFRRQVYYVAMEDLFSNGIVSKLISWLVAPIPIMKASTDIRAMLNCIKIARDGGTIALFPEGNRTYSGRTCYIKPSVASLAKKLGLPIAIFRIEGGYGIKPRWGVGTRKGRMTAGVRRIIEPAEYADLSNDELYELICKELYVDESRSTTEFRSIKIAEALERAIFICPECGLSEFETKGDTITCKKCGKQHKLSPDMRLSSVSGDTQFTTIAEWYDYQEDYIRNLDLTQFGDSAIYTEQAKLSEVIVYDRKHVLMKSADVSIYADRVEMSGGENAISLRYEDVKAMACIGGHKLNIFHGDKIYQLKGDRSFNALKYCNIYYHAKFIKEGHTDGEFQFLGL